MLHNLELRLKSRSGQDRGVKHKNYARTTDKSFPRGRIYSLLSRNNKMKRELRLGLRSQNPAPHILKYLDQIEILRVPGVDSAELRVGLYGNLMTSRPGHNGSVAVQLMEF